MASVLAKYPDYQLDIGMEIHIQLNTNTKIFCPCPAAAGQQANSNICPVCVGHPGVLPVLNKQVVENAIAAGLATNCTINERSVFARKHYFYPDLPKGYQITQDDKPTCSEGFVMIALPDGTRKKIRVKRIHIEEDAGKNIHGAGDESFVDLNRAGTPLLEMVSYPDLNSADEVRAYLHMVRLIMLYLNISSGNMEEGAFRADTNISVRKKNSSTLGTRCELKNINSFKFIADAIEYEAERQITALERGEKIVQQTRLWDSKNRETVPMRSKEDAADYRYMLEPDLPDIVVDESWRARVAARLPELPPAKLERLQQQYGLTVYEAEILLEDLALATYFEQAAAQTTSKQLINWVLRDIIGLVKEQKITIAECAITPTLLAELVDLLQNGTINNKAARDVFEIIAVTGQHPRVVVQEKGLEQVGSSEELTAIVLQIIAQYPDVVAEYKAGKERSFGFLIGTAMKATKGKGDPKLLSDLFKKHLA